MKYTDNVSNKLNELLEKTYDAERGYKLAAEKVENPTIKRFLNDKVQQRYAFGHELKKEIRQYGRLQDKGGSFAGDMHRIWMNLSSTLSPNDTERVLEEVERGEKASLEQYDEVLQDKELTLAPTTENLLKKQREAVKAAMVLAEKYEETVA